MSDDDNKTNAKVVNSIREGVKEALTKSKEFLDLQANIAVIVTKLEFLEQLSQGGKRSVRSSEKKTGDKDGLPANSREYFKKKYQVVKDFREATQEEYSELLNSEDNKANIAKAKKEEDKIKKEASIIWNTMGKEIHDAYKEELKQAKDRLEAGGVLFEGCEDVDVPADDAEDEPAEDEHPQPEAVEEDEETPPPKKTAAKAAAKPAAAKPAAKAAAKPAAKAVATKPTAKAAANKK